MTTSDSARTCATGPLADRLAAVCPPAAVTRFRESGFLHCTGLFSAAELAVWRALIGPAVAATSADAPPLASRGTYGQAFLQVSNLWEEHPAIRGISLHPLLGAIAARLLGCTRVRLYHDQALYKEAGGGHTPWHVDQVYWPLADERTVTAWIPLVDCPLAMGPLAFAEGSHRQEGWRHLTISDESHATIARLLHERGIPVRCRSFALGDVSFHSGWTAHCAGPNRSAHTREVMTVILMADDMRLAEPLSVPQENDRQRWCPGVAVGAVVDSPLNPLL